MQQSCLHNLWLSWSIESTTNDRELTEVKVQVCSILHLERNECKCLTIQRTINCESLLNPLVLISLICRSEYWISLLNAYSIFCSKYQRSISLTTLNLITEGDNVASLQSILCLKEVEILLIGRTEYTYSRTTHVSIIPYELCIKTACRNISSGTTEQLACKPPTPCWQIVLYTNVSPRTIVLAYTTVVEELTVTKVEVSDKWLLCQVPRHRTTCSHHS